MCMHVRLHIQADIQNVQNDTKETRKKLTHTTTAAVQERERMRIRRSIVAMHSLNGNGNSTRNSDF